MAKGHLGELQKAETVSKCKLVPSSLKHIIELITGNKSYDRGGRYRQVPLYYGSPPEFPANDVVG